ncbi:Protein arv1 [Phytophthora citrophthora]|uniref:Protein ARV n=1 Tax=Phytophthora citrophthora TaxID=4793 RepID=A0AAD9LR55_9STRA|nr:Protein arv1 [Phytophthora citrophthora]
MADPVSKMRQGLVCVECGASVPELVRDYGKGNLRLAICGVCNSVADKYVEYETILLFLEVLLLKPQVYRHVLCNLPAPVSARTTLKLFVILVMLDMNVKAYLVDRDVGVTFRSESMYRMQESLQAATSGLRIGQFSLHLVCLALVENVAYFLSIFATIWSDLFRRGWRGKLLANEESVENGVRAAWTRYASAMCISSFGKLFALLTVIWEFHWSFIHVIGALVVVSNVLALQLLLGEGDHPRSKSPHVVGVVMVGLIVRGAAQLALYAIGNSVLFHVLV